MANVRVPFYVIGNWKSNKTVAEAVQWFQDFTTLYKKQPYNPQKVRVILCASDIHLTTLKSLIELSRIPLFLAAQDVSPFTSGTYTGAVSAVMLQSLVNYVLVGHSERRKHFHEEDGELFEKVKRLKETALEPIYCVQGDTTNVPESCQLIAFEPPWAISGGDPAKGHPDTPEHAQEIIASIRHKLNREAHLFYGGSTSAENVLGYATQPDIDGVLPGGASLKADTFHSLITHATDSTN